MNIGKAIKIGLKKRGWSQKKLAEEMNVSPGLVSQWTKQQTTPPGNTLIKLIKVLDIFDEVFFTEEHFEVQPKTYFSVEIDKLNKEINNLKYSLMKKGILLDLPQENEITQNVSINK